MSTSARFMRNPQSRVKFLELDPMLREVFFNGFKTGVLQTLREKTIDELNIILNQLDTDYNEVINANLNSKRD